MRIRTSTRRPPVAVDQFRHVAQQEVGTLCRPVYIAFDRVPDPGPLDGVIFSLARPKADLVEINADALPAAICAVSFPYPASAGTITGPDGHRYIRRLATTGAGS